MTAMTLALDASAKPTSLIPIQEAVASLASDVQGEARIQVLASDERRRYRSQHLDLAAPLIMLFPGYIELEPNETRYVSRRVVFARDKYACQYCDFVADPGAARRQLTLDHVKPAHMFESRAEATTWENVTTACRECNAKKAGSLPRDCGMMPRAVPRQPHYVQLRFAGRLNSIQREYVADYFGEEIGSAL